MGVWGTCSKDLIEYLDGQAVITAGGAFGARFARPCHKLLPRHALEAPFLLGQLVKGCLDGFHLLVLGSGPGYVLGVQEGFCPLVGYSHSRTAHQGSCRFPDLALGESLLDGGPLRLHYFLKERGAGSSH